MQKRKLEKSNLEYHANCGQPSIRSWSAVGDCFHASQDVASLERALASFYAAVAKEYGMEEAAKAAEDWIEELQQSSADWRSVTIAAARRLARRVVTRSRLEELPAGLRTVCL